MVLDLRVERVTLLLPTVRIWQLVHQRLLVRRLGEMLQPSVAVSLHQMRAERMRVEISADHKTIYTATARAAELQRHLRVETHVQQLPRVVVLWVDKVQQLLPIVQQLQQRVRSLLTEVRRQLLVVVL